MGAEARWSDRVRSIELASALAMTVLLIVVHVVVLLHAGALWRDEVNAVNLATQPSLAGVWALSEYDSFPMLWPLVLRGWVALGLGATDLGLRALGLIVGLGLLAMLWWSARRLGHEIPMVSLLLFAASPTTFQVGDSVRGYGCGLVLMLLTLTSIWRVVDEPRFGRVAMASVAALLSVHALYYNSVILFALGMGGVAVGLRHRVRRTVVVMLGIGALAAVSMLPYLVTMLRMKRWTGLVKVPLDIPWIATKFYEAIAGSGEFVIWLWGSLFVLALGVWGWHALSSDASGSETDKDLARFLGTAVVVGVVCAWISATASAGTAGVERDAIPHALVTPGSVSHPAASGPNLRGRRACGWACEPL